MELEDMTRDEISLLLYLESCAVDQGGLIGAEHMNTADFKIAKQWSEDGFLNFGRVYSKDAFNLGKSHYCELTDEAHELAAQARKAKAVRTFEKRDWNIVTKQRSNNESAAANQQHGYS